MIRVKICGITDKMSLDTHKIVKRMRRGVIGVISNMIKIGWFAIGCFVSMVSDVSPHPHVFIDNTITIVFDQKGMAGIKTTWVFDEMFSELIIHDYDTDRDGAFSADEKEKIKTEVFSNLKNYHYFTYINIAGKAFNVQYVKDFSAYLDSTGVRYTFFIPCHIAATSSYKQIKIAMYDSTYYVDVRFENGDTMEYTYRIADNTQRLYYYGQIAPQEIILNFRKKDEADRE
jgi:ABC-type uncharacterized transport system substrate-binding protein